MENLEVKLIRIKNVLVFQVLNQKSDLKVKANYTILEENGYSLKKDTKPEIMSKALYIRGKRSEDDNKVCCYDYGTEEAAIEAAKNFKNLIDKINEESKVNNFKIENIM